MQALIDGTIYIINRGGLRHGATVYSTSYKLAVVSNKWEPFAQIPTSSINPFYATINGEGTNEDGFYVFGLKGSAVYKYVHAAVASQYFTVWAHISFLRGSFASQV